MYKILGGEIMLIFALINLFMSMLFFGIGVFAWNRKDPIWFWAGSKVDKEDITDVKSYNHENAIMWMVYGTSILITPIFIDIVGIWIFFIIYIVVIMGGAITMMIRYEMIYEKYEVKE